MQFITFRQFCRSLFNSDFGNCAALCWRQLIVRDSHSAEDGHWPKMYLRQWEYTCKTIEISHWYFDRVELESGLWLLAHGIKVLRVIYILIVLIIFLLHLIAIALGICTILPTILVMSLISIRRIIGSDRRSDSLYDQIAGWSPILNHAYSVHI